MQLQTDRDREYRRTHRMRDDKIFFDRIVGRGDPQYVCAVFTDKDAQASNRFFQIFVIDLFMRRIVRIYVIDIIHIFVVYVLYGGEARLVTVFERAHTFGIFKRTFYAAAERRGGVILRQHDRFRFYTL